MFWTRFLFIMELMVEHVSIRIQLGLMTLVVGAYFMVWVMLSIICSNCDPLRVLDFGDRKFPA